MRRSPKNKPKKIEISPSILSADFSRLGEQLAEVERAGADRVHIDVMDGHFVPPITMGPVIVAACRKSTRLPLEAHLMVEEPERSVSDFIKAGAGTIIFHQEAAPHAHRLIQRIHDLGALAGMALNPGTPASLLESVVGDLDLVLIMTVNPGYSGQIFIDSMLTKIRDLSAMMESRGLECCIEVDGGIAPATAPLAVEAGANILVAASAIFLDKDGVQAAMTKLQESIATKKSQ